MSCYINIEFICLDASPLATSLRQQAYEWIVLFGKLLHDIAKTNMVALQTNLDKFSYELVTDPDDLDELKSVLQVLTYIHTYIHTVYTCT